MEREIIDIYYDGVNLDSIVTNGTQLIQNQENAYELRFHFSPDFTIGEMLTYSCLLNLERADAETSNNIVCTPIVDDSENLYYRYIAGEWTTGVAGTLSITAKVKDYDGSVDKTYGLATLQIASSVEQGDGTIEDEQYQALLEAEAQSKKTANIVVTDPITESLSGEALVQQDVNQENKLIGDEVVTARGGYSTLNERFTDLSSGSILITDKLTESISELATTQALVNQENKIAIEANQADIDTNETSIQANADKIDSNLAKIDSNKVLTDADIQTNANDISTNAGGIVNNKNFIDQNTADIATKLPKASPIFTGTMQGSKLENPSGDLVLSGDNIDVNNKKIINVGAPLSAQDVATKNYVDNLTALNVKMVEYVEACSGVNLDITVAVTSIDGVTVASGDRVLLIGQATVSENGIYVLNASNIPVYSTYDGDNEEGAYVFVSAGDTYNDWYFTNTDGTTWLATGRPDTIMAGTGLEKVGNVISLDDETIETLDDLDTQLNASPLLIEKTSASFTIDSNVTKESIPNEFIAYGNTVDGVSVSGNIEIDNGSNQYSGETVFAPGVSGYFHIEDYANFEDNVTYTFKPYNVIGNRGISTFYYYDSDSVYHPLSFSGFTLDMSNVRNNEVVFRNDLTNETEELSFDLMINKGTAPMPYKPYDSTYLPYTQALGTLQSVGTVQDTHDLVTGRTTKNVGEYVFSGNEYAHNIEDLGSVYRFWLDKVSDNTQVSSINVNIKEYPLIGDNSNYTGDYEHIYSTSTKGLYLFISKTAIDSQVGSTLREQAQAFLSGKTLMYEATSPEIIDNAVIPPTLNGGYYVNYPNGLTGGTYINQPNSLQGTVNAHSKFLIEAKQVVSEIQTDVEANSSEIVVLDEFCDTQGVIISGNTMTNQTQQVQIDDLILAAGTSGLTISRDITRDTDFAISDTDGELDYIFPVEKHPSSDTSILDKDVNNNMILISENIAGYASTAYFTISATDAATGIGRLYAGTTLIDSFPINMAKNSTIPYSRPYFYVVPEGSAPVTLYAKFECFDKQFTITNGEFIVTSSFVVAASVASTSAKVVISTPATESLSGNSLTQQEVNIENKTKMESNASAIGTNYQDITTNADAVDRLTRTLLVDNGETGVTVSSDETLANGTYLIQNGTTTYDEYIVETGIGYSYRTDLVMKGDTYNELGAYKVVYTNTLGVWGMRLALYSETNYSLKAYRAYSRSIGSATISPATDIKVYKVWGINY